jgi:hypothetical protein
MPLVIEAKDSKECDFLQEFLASNSKQIIDDISHYGAVLLRGFNISTDEQFEKIILSIPDFHGISEAFMSEHGRLHVDNLKYVLHTSTVYKTGGTLYLGGFHTENYYSADVPGYIFFCCFEPSLIGGETGMINMEKVYHHLSDHIKEKLEKKAFFVCKWSVSEIAERYQLPQEKVKKMCDQFQFPILGDEEDQFVLMYKPSVFEHPLTKGKSLQINMLELPTFNKELRKCFLKDYQGKTWFWHRFFWKLPTFMVHALEFLAVICISFFHSPKESFKIVRTKFNNFKASKKSLPFNGVKVGSCFSKKEVKELAQLMRQYYSSCLWNKGDILLIDNKKVLHSGMPGKGPRLIRAIISNPIAMNYSPEEAGFLVAKERATDTIGAFMTSGTI